MSRTVSRHVRRAKRRLVLTVLLQGMLVLAHHPSPLAKPLGHSHGEIAEQHSCEHHKAEGDRAKYGLVTKTAPQVYARATRSGRVGDRENDAARALRRGRGMREQVVSPRWQPIRIGVSYASVGANREHHCYEEGEVTKVGSPRANSPACTPPAADGSVASDSYETDCWYMCTAEDVLTPEKQALLEQQVAEVMALFQSLLSIERVQGPLRVASSASCGRDGGVSFPEAYLDAGVPNTDLILMATARPTLGSTLAWAVACERDQWGRTVAGQVNVAPRYVESGSLQLLQTVLQHEVIHVLGFDPNAFELYRDEANRLRGAVTQSKYEAALGASVTRVVTPRVEMYGRQHFGVADDVADFPGIELENNGGVGTVGSHWERRVMGTEMMTGTVKANAPLSRITLALLEDSGWYMVHNDSSLADNHFTWGFGEGQSFLTQPCNTRSEQYYCQVMREEGCVPDRSAIGYCANDSLALSCPTFNAYSNGDCSTGTPETRYGEVRGPMAKCLSSTLVLSSAPYSRSPATSSGCYDARCTTEGTVQVAVNSQWRACPPEGGSLLQWDGYHGTIECPVAAQFCALSNATLFQCPASCNFRGLCRGGACECFLGWGGESCELQVCPNDCSGSGRCVTAASGGQTCMCDAGFSGADCSARQCEENCYLAGGVCTAEGTCEVVCSNRPGYQCVDVAQLRDNGLDFCDGMYDDGASVCAPVRSGGVGEMEQETIIVQYEQLVSEGPIPFALPDVAGIGPTQCKAKAREMTCKLYLQPCGSDNSTALSVCESLCDATNANCWTKMDCAGESFASDDNSSASCSGAKASVGFHQTVEFVWVAIFIAISTVGCSVIVVSRRLLRSCWKPQPAAVDLPQGAPPLHYPLGMGPVVANGYPAATGVPMVSGGASDSRPPSTSQVQLPPSHGGFTTLDNAFDAPPPPTQMDNPLLPSPARFSERWQ